MNIDHLTISNILIALIILVFIVKRQLAIHVINFKIKLYIILIVVGLSQFTKIHNLDINSNFYLFVTLSLLTVVISGILRAFSSRIFLNTEGVIVRQGTYLTLLLLLLTIAAKYSFSSLWQYSSLSILVTLGLSLMVQRGTTWLLASTKFPENITITKQFLIDAKRKNKSSVLR